MTLISSVFEQGMIYAVMALGVYITYKILDFPDLTVDGSFPLGASHFYRSFTTKTQNKPHSFPQPPDAHPK